MLWTPLLVFHISCATVGLLSGFLAMGLRKGSGPHGAAGTVFFVSMLGMSSSAVIMATFHQLARLNVVAGLLTFYLVATGWRAARRREGGATPFDIGAALFALALGAAGVMFGFQAARSPGGTLDRMPAAGYFVFGSIALLCAVADARLLARGGAVGTQRIVRHLWRMCAVLLFTAISFYPGQARLFPQWLRETRLLLVPSVFLVGAMVFWLRRVKGRKQVPRKVSRTPLIRMQAGLNVLHEEKA